MGRMHQQQHTQLFLTARRSLYRAAIGGETRCLYSGCVTWRADSFRYSRGRASQYNTTFSDLRFQKPRVPWCARPNPLKGPLDARVKKAKNSASLYAPLPNTKMARLLVSGQLFHADIDARYNTSLHSRAYIDICIQPFTYKHHSFIHTLWCDGLLHVWIIIRFVPVKFTFH